MCAYNDLSSANTKNDENEQTFSYRINDDGAITIFRIWGSKISGHAHSSLDAYAEIGRPGQQQNIVLALVCT